MWVNGQWIPTAFTELKLQLPSSLLVNFLLKYFEEVEDKPKFKLSLLYHYSKISSFNLNIFLLCHSSLQYCFSSSTPYI